MNKNIKMKKSLSILFSILFTIGCYEDLRDVKVGKMNDYTFDEDIQINNLSEAVIFVKEYITYKPDENGDYWQLPEETYNLKTGDCDDYGIFLMYLAETKLNIQLHMIIVEHLFTGNLHILVATQYNLIDATKGEFLESLPYYYDIIHVIPYEEVMWMTYHYHDNVGKYY